MNSTMNQRIINYKSLNKKEKELYIKYYITENTTAYNEYKNILKFIEGGELEYGALGKDEQNEFYTLRMKNHMSRVLLYNSILKKNKENIIKNFNDFNKHQLEFMEIMEEISERDNCLGFLNNLNDDKTKPGEKYRLVCIEIKEEYELLKYIIEDYNNIKL